MFKNGNSRNPSSTDATQARGQGAPNETRVTRSGGSSVPAISLPKGGGAIRGIGEKFAANPVTGTAALTIPLATSPGRSGFGPELSLSYDSGSGNGPFGFGWNLSLPTVTRKTDKGLPRYWDGDESDVFVLSGAEDLVPVLVEVAGHWQGETLPTRIVDGTTYGVRRYRPRIEGLFSRIERWTDIQTGEIHWRSITRDNVTTLYGKDDNSKIFSPAGANQPKREFSWLICQSHDDKGNVIVYEYAPEDDQNVDRTQANERNRLRTTNRYLKRIKYGNSISHLVEPDLSQMEWMFEVVFDYEEGHYEDVPLNPALTEGEQHQFVLASAVTGLPWPVRPDAFSSYRGGFEVRTYRRCKRVLMFHHFDELAAEPYLVRCSEFDYADFDYSLPAKIEEQLAHAGSTRFGSFVRSITQSGFVRDETQPVVERDGVEYLTYLKKSLPPLEFEYSRATIQDEVRELDEPSLENLPAGFDGSTYQWVDLDGEGISGVLINQADAWFFKPNLGNGHFGPLKVLPLKPSLTNPGRGSHQLLDLAGDGQLDLVTFAEESPGFYERTQDQQWETFRPFTHLPNISWNDPNLRFVDLTGDGHADILITEDEVLTWYPSLAEEGFDSAARVRKPFDEERGPRLVLADGSQSIYLADMSGDGLSALVRIGNGEVCYWPNLGYGRFGSKVTMDDAPRFDNPDEFDNRRIRLADIDGSGSTDIIYLARDGVRLYFNQSGNRWSEPRYLSSFPHLDNLSSVMTADLLGNGTACLVWSSPLPADQRNPVRYIDLMGGQKPHLLVKTVNNLGAETALHYSSSTKFYLQDKARGAPWITKLPFPVHVVERADTYDRISGNLFVTRYSYHHGYFDGVEREFRGFGMVEQLDTEEFAALNATQQFPVGTNVDASSHIPPVLTRTWFHTGVFLSRRHVSDFFAGTLGPADAGEYYREPGLTDEQARELLLDDTMLPAGLTVEEEREACRALKGSMLRQEIYALDGTGKEKTPYTVSEQNFTVTRIQPPGQNRHAVFFTHPREALSYHYERDPSDPRVGHQLTLEVDDFGNILKSASVNYGRRENILIDDGLGGTQVVPNPGLDGLNLLERSKQTTTLITYTESTFTNPVAEDDDYRTPVPCETRSYELTGLLLFAGSSRFSMAEILTAGSSAVSIAYEQTPTAGVQQKRLIEHVRTLYRRNDLVGPLALGQLESLKLPFESYKLAFTPSLLNAIYAGRTNDAMLSEAGYLHSEGDANWWAPSGRVFYSPNPTDSPAQEVASAQSHFFLPHRYRDPFHTSLVSTETFVTYDGHDLLMQQTRDALGNLVTVGERDAVTNVITPGHDYRVLKPGVIMGPNRNRTAVVFDALGLVVGTALMGKPEDIPQPGDSLPANFKANLTVAEIDQFVANPGGPIAVTLLNDATTRIIYDLTRYWREPNPLLKSPAFFSTLARETHAADPVPPGGLKIQVSFSYADGFSREIQRKIQAEAGPAPERDGNGKIIVDADGQPLMTVNDVSPRWVGSGWTVFNNKGRPVRQYEPFFTDTHDFEFDVRIGVSPVLFYDPVERVVATLHPNHSWEKTVFDPWQQETWDANDAVLVADPRNDPDVSDFFLRLPVGLYLPTWYAQRQGGAMGPQEQSAARKAAVHADTPALTHFDTLGRSFLTVAHNKFKLSTDPPADPPIEEFQRTFLLLDIESNQREVRDALDRVVMRYDFDMLGNRAHRASMDSGERWMLNDVAGERLYGWDSRNQQLRTSHDPLRRATHSFLSVGAGAEVMVGRTIFGETVPAPEVNNLRGRVVQVFDQAGTVETNNYDFKGNPLRSARRLAVEYKTTLDWSAAVPLEPNSYTNQTRFDALNRAVELTAPDNSVVRPTYNEANMLERVEVNLRGEQQNGAPVWTSFITDIDYDARGERTLIDYGNGVRTIYEYDRLHSRLARLVTRRDASNFPDDCPAIPPEGWPGCQVQNLGYTYDPAGNVTHIRDGAQQSVYFSNRRVEPTAEFTYDAIYQLIEATGREHLGQTGNTANAPTPPDPFDNFHSRLNHPGDGNAFGTYLDQYAYDAVGNILSVQHRGTDPAQPGWTRSYAYSEPSQLEAAKLSNRLTSTALGAIAETYHYDGSAGLHGNITRLPHLPLMAWDYRDQLQATSQQVVNNGTPETTWYVYDTSGRRVRKVTDHQTVAGQTPVRMKERVYIGGFEVYREYGNDGDTVDLERETLHLMDDEQRVALIETRTAGVDPAPARLIRYQFGNHLGSAALELDDQSQIVSYEEYYPFGGTSYQAVRSQTETSKRYRYTGKERDEESGLYYFGARHYASWLGRWMSADPLGIEDGVNVYEYVGNSPMKFVDLLGTKKGDKLPEHKGKIGKFTEKEINDAIKTVYGELTAKPHKDTAKEAKAVASTILNRQARIETTRKEFATASAAKQTALQNHQKERADLDTANAEFTKFTKEESKNKKEIGKTITEKDPKKRKALIDKAFADKVQTLRDAISKEKGELDTAGSELQKKEKAFATARDAKTDAESFVKKDKRSNSAITLSDIVEVHAQYAGTKKGKDDFAKFPDMSENDQKNHKLRYEAAVKAVEDLVNDPSKADKYIEFKGGNLRPKGALAGETKIGGNFFK